MLSNKDYRQTLKSQLLFRQKINPSFGQRAFARLLNIAPSQLNAVLNGKRGLSIEKAKALASKLFSSSIERDFFVTQVKANHARSKRERLMAQKKLAEKASAVQVTDYFYLRNWKHYAFLELFALEDFKNSDKWICNKLGINEVELEEITTNLIQLGLLEKNGNDFNIPCSKVTNGPDEIPSEYIQDYHELMLKTAQSALKQFAVDQRDFTSVIVSVDSKEMPEAKKMIREFLANFTEKFSSSSMKKDDVCNISVQLFSLLNDGDKNEIN